VSYYAQNAGAITRGKNLAAARRILAAVPVYGHPFRAEPFVGYLTTAGGGRVTDWHIVDARGRTCHVLPYYAPQTVKRRGERATAYAAAMNELTA
jgi:hypothetical protein